MLAQRWMWILWPSFLVAGVLEMVVFALVDPAELHWFGHHLEFARETVYAGAFFVFWAGTFISSALTTLLSMSPSELNQPTASSSTRSQGRSSQIHCSS